jgi:hypothetical protein
VRRSWLRAAGCGWLAVLAVGAVPAAAASTGSWGPAQEVPGLAALTNGDGVYVAAVSCPTAGTCGAGGSYVDKAGHGQGFVVSERDGVWQPALEVPGLDRLNAGGRAAVTSVSCPSPGRCTAAGYCTDSTAASQDHGFVAGQP